MIINITKGVTIQTSYYNTDHYIMLYVSISNESIFIFSFKSGIYIILITLSRIA